MYYKQSNSDFSFLKKSLPLHGSFPSIAVMLIFLCSCTLSGYTNTGSKKVWVGSWSTATQLVEPGNMPPVPGLSDNTLRQVIRVSLGGEILRVKFSNEFSTGPLTMREVQIAVSKGGGTVETATIKELKFNGKREVTVNPGCTITSDQFSFHLDPGMDIAITIYFGQTPPDLTGHPGSRTTSYLLTGKMNPEFDFKNFITIDHWYIISGIDVKASESAGAVAVLGNSITDGRGSGTNRQNRWPDILAQRLMKNPATRQVAVLNLGIGGNCVLRNCLGPSALERFERDVLMQQGVKWLILLEGINDIGQTRDSAAASQVARDLIAAYGRMIDAAHAKGIKVFGATMTPFGKSFYYTEYRETARNAVNEWIRNSGRFDAIIDFDKVLRNPEDIQSILTPAHSGDFLHPNETGYKMMGEIVDLKLFK